MSGTNLLQGNISLTDTPGDAGGTCLLPGFHHEMLDWVRSFPPLDPEAPGIDGNYQYSALLRPSRGGWPGRDQQWAVDPPVRPCVLPQRFAIASVQVGAQMTSPPVVV